MGKNYMRVREVMYTLSPNEVDVMGGLWKNMDKKLIKKVKDVSPVFVRLSAVFIMI